MNKAAQKAKTAGAVVYTRVSTGEQAEHGTSLETQRDACRQKALALGLPIVNEYEDAGFSGGFLASRPGMMAALADIQTGRADTLICANISRFSRDSEHQQAMLKSVRSAGGRLVFCDTTFEDTPDGDMMFGVMGQFAQWEKAVIKKRTMTGRARRAQQGHQPARAHSPFGYRIISRADVLRGEQPADMAGKYLVIEAEAAVVRELYARYAAGTHSLPSLARWLNAEGVPTRQGAACWAFSVVKYILRNPVYKGQGVYGRWDHSHDEGKLAERHPHTGMPFRTTKVQKPADPETWITFPVPAIVPEDLWDAAQARFQENQRRLGGNPRRVRMLSGRVLCPECGAHMCCQIPDSRRGRRPAHRYVCGHYLRTIVNTGTAGCVPTGYPVEETEAAVVTAFEDGARRPEHVRHTIAAAVAAQSAARPVDDGGAQLARVEEALAALDARQQATVKAQIAGVMAGADPGAYAAVFAEIAAQRERLEERRRDLSRAQGHREKAGRREATAADFPRILADVRRVLTSPKVPATAKRDMIGRVVEAVYPVKGGARVTFVPGVFGPGGERDTLQVLL